MSEELNNQGAVPAVDAKTSKSKNKEQPKKEKAIKKDRLEPTAGKNKNKKIDFIALAMIGLCVVVVFGGFFALTGGEDAKPHLAEASTEIDETTVVKNLDSSSGELKKYQTEILAQQAEDEAIAKQKEEERLRIEAERLKALADKKEKEAKDNKKGDTDTPSTTHGTVPVPVPIVTEDTGSTNGSNSDQPTPRERKLASAVMPAIPAPQASTQPTQATNNSLDSKSFAEGFASTKWRNKRDLLLIHGTNIPCALRTEIISTFSGLVTCSVISDVYSANGNTLLIEKGSNVFGTQSIALEQGQARVFVTWSDIQTPQGVSIQIDSLGTGRLGASGVDAWVDNHFKERFGGAILLAFLDDAFATLANRTTNSNISTDNTQENASDMASKALENSINIPPTGYVPIGTRLNILVARDIDMSNVYQLVPIK